ncbi:MAG: glycosyl hydrolase family 18 protein [Candidatus Omnitrophota bacterium]
MKHQNKAILFYICAITLFCFFLGYASLQNKTIESWLAYWDVKNSLEILKTYFLGKITNINLFLYALDKDGNIINTLKEPDELKQIIEFLRKNNIKISVTFTNDVIYSQNDKRLKDSGIVNKILSDDSLRQKHIKQILEISRSINADGVDIDYESININDKDIFTQFIEELSFALHNDKKNLIVTVQQKTENHQRTGAGAIDWREISRYADKIIIMCYNYSSKVSGPGPICPIYWLKDIIRFAKTQIPLDKICIALPLHGYDWSKEGINSINLQKVEKLFLDYPLEKRWDKKSQSPYFRYSKGGVKHEVWFEDKESLSEKIQIIKNYHINNIALWHVGILDPSLSDTLQDFLN